MEEIISSPTHSTLEIIISLEAGASFSDLISLDLIAHIRDSQTNLKQRIRDRELHLSDEADKLCSESFDCCLKVFGPDHPTTQSSVSILAELKYSQGDHSEAEKMYQMALECNLKALGPYHLDTIKIVNLIAEVLFNAQDFNASEENYRKVLEGYEKALGPGCAQSFQAMHNIGKCLFHKKQLIDARMVLIRAFEGRSKLLGEQHLDTIYTLYELGVVYHFESHWRHKPDADTTRGKAEKVLAMEQRTVGEQCVATLESKYKLATILELQRKVHEGYMRLSYQRPVVVIAAAGNQTNAHANSNSSSSSRRKGSKDRGTSGNHNSGDDNDDAGEEEEEEILAMFKQRADDAYLQHCNSNKRYQF
eukprot:gene32992-42688_t